MGARFQAYPPPGTPTAKTAAYPKLATSPFDASFIFTPLSSAAEPVSLVHEQNARDKACDQADSAPIPEQVL